MNFFFCTKAGKDTPFYGFNQPKFIDLAVQIVVNTRLLQKDRLEGIGWFTCQTLERITKQNPDVHFVFVFDRPYSEEFIFSENITPVILSPKARHPFLYWFWLQVQVKSLLRRMKPDLFLSPDGMLVLGAGCRQLPVIHDINFLHYPQHSKWLTSKYYNYFFPRFAREATRIATVSEFSRNDIASSYAINPSKIDVVYNGVNAFFKPLSETEKNEVRLKYSHGKPYFLYVGSLHPRKNIPSLIRAFAAFKAETQSEVCLILAGPPFWGLGEIRNAIAQSKLGGDIVVTGRLPDSELALVMGAALAFTYLPLFEGFGIPLLEAMEAGVPIIASNTSSLPEVAGAAALLVDPLHVDEIKNAMSRIYKNEDLRKELIVKGFTQKQNFSWDKSAALLWQSILKTMA